VSKVRGNIRITSKPNSACGVHTKPENHIKNTIISAVVFLTKWFIWEIGWGFVLGLFAQLIYMRIKLRERTMSVRWTESEKSPQFAALRKWKPFSHSTAYWWAYYAMDYDIVSGESAIAFCHAI